MQIRHVRGQLRRTYRDDRSTVCEVWVVVHHEDSV